MLKLICSMIALATAALAADPPAGVIKVNPELTIIAAVGGDQCLFARGLGDSVIIQCAADVGTINIVVEHIAEALVRVSNVNGVKGSFREISWTFKRLADGNLGFDILAQKLEQSGELPGLQ